MVLRSKYLSFSLQSAKFVAETILGIQLKQMNSHQPDMNAAILRFLSLV